MADSSFAPQSITDGNKGDITLSGSATAYTLNTVNSNVGSFGTSTQSPTVTVNAKGLVTAASNTTVTPAVGSITGLGTGVSTFLATPSSANLATAVTDETGSGALVFATSPTLVTPALGTPSALVATNATGTAAGLTSGITNALKSATTTVDVSAATAPTSGQVLTATSSTAATWQTPSGGGGSSVACRVIANSATSMTTSWVKVAFGAEQFDTDTMHDNSTNNTRITINTAGTYSIGGTITATGSPNTNYGARILLNNTTVIASQNEGNIGDPTASVSTTYALIVGDYIELQGYSSTANNCSSTETTNFWAFKVANVSGGSGTVTSVGFTGGLISVATATTTPALTVAGTSGGVPYFSSASTWATSAALAANALVIGGGAGVAPATTTTGTGVLTALGVNTGTAGAFVVNGGALGTPSSATLTNATGLPIAGLVASTSTAIGVGSIELGNASDTTLSRAAAGDLAVEGVSVLTTSNTKTVTNKDVSSATNTIKKVTNTASSATPTPTGDSDFNYFYVTALATNATFAAPSGTPKDGNSLVMRVTPDATPRTLAYNAIYRAIGVTLPTVTVASKTMYFGGFYNSTSSTWDITAYGIQA